MLIHARTGSGTGADAGAGFLITCGDQVSMQPGKKRSRRILFPSPFPGVICFITISVFRAEKTSSINLPAHTVGYDGGKQAVLTGYSQRADSMFVAVLKK